MVAKMMLTEGRGANCCSDIDDQAKPSEEEIRIQHKDTDPQQQTGRSASPNEMLAGATEDSQLVLHVCEVLSTSHATFQCECLSLEDRIKFIGLNKDLWHNCHLHEIILRVSADELRRLLTDAKTLGEKEFKTLFKTLGQMLRLMVHTKVKNILAYHEDDPTQKREEQMKKRNAFLHELRTLFPQFLFWIEQSLATDPPGAFQQRRRFLRDMKPKLWFAAMEEYKELSPYFFQVLCRWPLNFEDRDIFLKEVGASMLKFADRNDQDSILWACKFACRYSCGSVGRVGCVEDYLPRDHAKRPDLEILHTKFDVDKLDHYKFSVTAANALNSYVEKEMKMCSRSNGQCDVIR